MRGIECDRPRKPDGRHVANRMLSDGSTPDPGDCAHGRVERHTVATEDRLAAGSTGPQKGPQQAPSQSTAH